MMNEKLDDLVKPIKSKDAIRKTSQDLLPLKVNDSLIADHYSLFPFSSLGNGKIFSGYDTLAAWIIAQKSVIIDGYVGIIWDTVKDALQKEFDLKNIRVNWSDTADYYKQEVEIESLVQPFLGEAGSVWGSKTTLNMEDLFQTKKLQDLKLDASFDLNIVIGTGAALVDWDSPILYFDLPKNEIQYRMRAGSVTNIGKLAAEHPDVMYKRCFFVDWEICNAHKNSILNKINAIADGQQVETVNWAKFDDLLTGLEHISRSVFRVRPWFSAGAWGGQWMKKQIQELHQDEINYAWSFELIVPENGIVFESDDNLLEISFDFLMFAHYRSVLGKHADQFKTEFPIRFDFLDTFKGGNLSIQCHPSLAYIQKEFGQNITQDETYYILDCEKDAGVYLGFQYDIDADEFRSELENSHAEGKEIDIEKFVQFHSAKKHDLFLIPNSTVHSAGTDNLVLEISATPYIFTFKMYDWVRPDLNGNPRPINIEHAFNNLNFERKGEKVSEELISKQVIIKTGNDWEVYHLPTHPEHFYDIHRIHFKNEVEVETNDVCHVLMLVEGTSVEVETADGTRVKFNYAETFVIPAAAKSYKLSNVGAATAKVIKAFLK